MKNCFQVALATLALVGLSGAARADLTISGAVGLPLNPTAQIPQEGGARIQGNYYRLGDGASDYGIVGATRLGDGLEINGGVTRLSGGGESRTGPAIGVKYLFSRETDPVGVRFAVGAGYDRALIKQTYIYAVATKYLGAVTGEKIPIVAHLGVRYDRFSGASSKASAYLGAEVPIVADGSFQAVGEIQSKNVDGGSTPYSASVRYRPKGQPFGASIGVARQGIGRSGVFAQVGYSFGTR